LYGAATEYVTEWIQPFIDLKCMAWVLLRKIHTWEDVFKSLEFMSKKKIILSEPVDETGLFDEYCYFKIRRRKPEILNEKKFPEDRWWKNIFRHLKQRNIQLTNTSTVVEFVCLHGKRNCGKDVFTG
jgi:hypothetical protein